MDSKKKKALKELVFDSIPQELKGLILRIALMHNGYKKICVITFASPLALQKWKQTESTILENMRNLYKQRDLKGFLVFHQVVAEVSSCSRENPIVIPKYKERSLGEFENHCVDDENLRMRFEAIRKIVKQNLNKSRQGVLK